jgi:hypothetical protein
MTFTPLISIYQEGDFHNNWSGNDLTKAIWIFSKNFGYHKKLSKTRVNIHIGLEDSIRTTGSIKSIRIKNGIDTSTQMSGKEKIDQLIGIIASSLKAIGSIEGWEMETIEKAYRLSLADNGHFVWHSKVIANKKRSLKAGIKMVLEEDRKVKIIAEYFDNSSNLLFEIHIIDVFPHRVDWNNTFSKPGWIDNEKFGFSLLNGQLLIIANCTSRQSETIIEAKDWTLEEVEGHLRTLIFRQFSNDKEIIDWINQ